MSGESNRYDNRRGNDNRRGIDSQGDASMRVSFSPDHFSLDRPPINYQPTILTPKLSWRLDGHNRRVCGVEDTRCPTWSLSVRVLGSRD